MENYPTLMQISGNELADMMVTQVAEHGADMEFAEAMEIRKNGEILTVVTDMGDYEGRAVIIAAGSKHRQLGLERENELVGRGVSYCAVCDGAFFAGQDVVVVGGGNTALQEAVMLSEYCTHVTVLQNLSFMTGELKLVAALEKKSNVSMIFDTVVEELLGDEKLEAVRVRNTKTDEVSEISTDGLFVAIGQKPENKCFESVTNLNEYGYIVADENCLTDTEGVFVAGDCRTKAIRQITTATADGAVAALAACRYIDSK